MNFTGFAQKPIHIYTELPNHILIHYYTWDKGRFTPGGDILVDKMKMSSSQYHLVNDFYGNLPIPNPNNRFNKGRLIFNVEPAALQDMTRSPSRLRQMSSRSESPTERIGCYAP